MLNLDLVEVTTPVCMRCGNSSVVNVPAEVMRKLEDGWTIQDAWPYSTPQDREMLKTGIHPDCWEIMFSGSDCD